MRRKIIIGLSVVVATVVGLLVFNNNSESPFGPEYKKVDGYNHLGGPDEVACAAVAPECGVCYGEVVDNDCWVNPDELDESEKQVMGL